MRQFPTHFRDANYNSIPYDGSDVQWRVSIYGICIVDEKLLLIKHQDEKYYDIPGGGIEMDETLAEGLAREGLEEAGWKLQLIQPVTVLTDYFYHTGEKKFYKSLQMYWLAEGEQVWEKPTEEKIKEVVLVPLEKLHEYEIYPNVRTALSNLQKF